MAFYVVRFLLGVAEAGFFPGMILYLTYWFPWDQRAKIVATFMLAIPISSVVGAPLSTAILDTHLFGLKGWQTMFLVEGVPAILLGLVVWLRMADRPGVARWLSEDEKTVLQRAIERDHAPHPDHLHALKAAFARPQVWGFGVMYFGVAMANYGLGFWLPQIVKGFGGLSNLQTGLLSALPYLLSVFAMVLWSRHSDRTGERKLHFALPAAVAAACYLAAGLYTVITLRFAALTLGAVATPMAVPMLWALPTRFLRGAAAAGGIALINSVGNLAGYVGPTVMGFMKEATGVYGGGLLALAAGLLMSAALTLVVTATPRLRPA
jgi:ACS family tartrate transporter-like MFS transporter